MGVIRAAIGCAVLVSGLLLAAPVTAQPLGTYRWQLQPYCNVINVAVVQQGGQYQLDGTDDQCGAAQAASVRGLAFLNPNGSIGFGLTIVTAPGGTPVHVDATIVVATLSGTWRDSAGNTGTFTYTPGGIVPGLPPRPVPTVFAGAFKRTSFSATVAAVGSPAVNVASITFTPAISGHAVLDAGGYCNFQGGASTSGDNGILLSFGDTEAQAFSVGFADMGIARLAQQAPGAGFYQLGWTVNNSVPVSAGVSTTVRLWARHEVGNVGTTCRGQFKVTVVGTLMP